MLRIFELTKNEQRVVLIIMLILIIIAFVAYERRMHPRFPQTTAAAPKPSPTAVETQDELTDQYFQFSASPGIRP